MDSTTQKTRVFLPIPPAVEQVGKIVLNAAYRVHTELGPGLLESVYEACLTYEIRESGLPVETQVAVPVIYRNIRSAWFSHQLYCSTSQGRHQTHGCIKSFVNLRDSLCPSC
jgi:hypothetical protein